MNILHFTYEIDNRFISENIAKELNINYKKNTVSQWHLNDYNHEEIILIIIDYSEENNCEEIIKYFNMKSNGLLPIVVRGKDIEFSNKKNLYHLGASLIFSNQNQFKNELENLFIFAKKQNRILSLLKKMRLAVIDDSRLSLEIMKDYFEKINISEVSYFSNPRDFLMDNSQYDLYIVDLVMPDFTGQEIIQEIKRKKREAIILTITTYGEGFSIPQSLSIGASDFLIKPFTFKLFILRLISCIQEHLVKIEKKKNQQKLHTLANKDHLTGLYNRRFFFNYMKDYMLNNNHLKFSLILLDLDHFKLINDQYGHQSGDEVLKEVSGYLSKSLRESDIIARWGGEEFIILLPNAELNSASNIAENLRMGIQDLEIAGVDQVTASFGVTEYLTNDTEESLFSRVDNSLYLAKFTGRNKVIVDEDLSIENENLPVNIEWGAFFRSGHNIIDKEHRELINMSNEIIKLSFMPENNEKIISLFETLITHIAEHFENEEIILKEYNYVDYDHHKRIHEDLVNKTMIFFEKFKARELQCLNVAKYVIQEVVVGHIIKSDFEYYDLFNQKINS